MIGVGTDIIEIDRVRAVYERHGMRFAERILVAAERETMAATNTPWRYLAKRFAAKEAIAKCLGTGIGRDLGWQDMSIGRDGAGAPLVQLSPRGSALARSRGGSQVLISIADERAYAVAFAVLVA